MHHRETILKWWWHLESLSLRDIHRYSFVSMPQKKNADKRVSPTRVWLIIMIHIHHFFYYSISFTSTKWPIEIKCKRNEKMEMFRIICGAHQFSVVCHLLVFHGHQRWFMRHCFFFISFSRFVQLKLFFFFCCCWCCRRSLYANGCIVGLFIF